MVNISDSASQELTKVLEAEQHKGKGLFVNFTGFGWSGPVLGLALDEPNDTYSQFNSNGIDVYMHADMVGQIQQLGGVDIDFVDNGSQQRGFMVTTKKKPDGADCSGCPSASESCDTD